MSEQKTRVLTEQNGLTLRVIDSEFYALQAERDALAAQVDALKKIAYCADGARQSNSEGNYGDEKEWLRHLYNGVGEYDCTATPQHHLAAHDAEVAAKAVEDAANALSKKNTVQPTYDKFIRTNELMQYAAQLHAKAKQ